MTYFYHWASEQDAADAGAIVNGYAAQGCTRVPGPVWITKPVMTPPDGDGESVVDAAGVLSNPVVVIRKQHMFGWEDFIFQPEDSQGYA